MASPGSTAPDRPVTRPAQTGAGIDDGTPARAGAGPAAAEGLRPWASAAAG
ncbi:hypothetical protein ABWJ92_06370 [Streptomyces sp. NPDC000609]|uniref:hypothetical protein n=1 Tax=Streptomyces sp. NPDC000609 TaxID=3160957 RepID=UPI003399B9D9